MNQNEKPYKLAVFIGRFQPIHNAHLKIIKKALSSAEKVLIIVGSANKPRTKENPFTFAERVTMIVSCLQQHELERIIVEPSEDTFYTNQLWAKNIQEIVGKFEVDNSKIAIFGHKKQKDNSTFYLDMFPQWKFVDVPYDGDVDINASKIRELYFGKESLSYIHSVVPIQVLSCLKDFRKSQEYQDIVEEIEFEEKYKQPYKALPYPVTFNTVDAVVFQSGNVLLIKRRARPGKGLWALPGGFLDAVNDQSLESAMLRELREETGLKVPEPVLKGCIKEVKTFDAVKRSSRGRTITQAFNIVLPDNGQLPKVKGQDDAEKAVWVPFSQLRSDNMFEDHYEIIQYFIGKN